MFFGAKPEFRNKIRDVNFLIFYLGDEKPASRDDAENLLTRAPFSDGVKELYRITDHYKGWYPTQ